MSAGQPDKIDFGSVRWFSVEWTMLGTLYLRAYESRSPHSILHDHAAAEAVERIDYDFERTHRWLQPAANQYVAALRAKKLDDWAAAFLAAHPDAVVLHLGCGLDSRAFRLAVPTGVDWFDIDQPEVITLRRKIFAEQDHYRMIGTSVTEADVFDEVPTGRPVLVIAEGLLMYLTRSQVRELLEKITDRFGSGEVIFDAIQPPWVAVTPLQRWGTWDAHELGHWNPRLRLADRASLIGQGWKIANRAFRGIYAALDLLPGVRDASRLYRFTILDPTSVTTSRTA